MTKVAASKEKVKLFLSLVFNLINSADPYEMQPYAASHVNIHSLTQYQLKGFQRTKG